MASLDGLHSRVLITGQADLFLPVYLDSPGASGWIKAPPWPDAGSSTEDGVGSGQAEFAETGSGKD